MVPVRLLRNGLSMGAKLAYTVFLSFAWQDGETFVKQDKIAEALNRSLAQTKRYILELEQAGLIRRERRGWPAMTYYVLLPVSSPMSQQETPLSSTVSSPMSLPASSLVSYMDEDSVDEDSAGVAYEEATPAPLATPSALPNPNTGIERSESEGVPVYPAGIAMNGVSANGAVAFPLSSLESLENRDEGAIGRAEEIVTLFGSDASDGEFVALVRAALTESAAGVEREVADVLRRMANRQSSNPSGLLIRKLNSGDHRRPGRPQVAQAAVVQPLQEEPPEVTCRFCSETEVEDYSRLHDDGSPMLLCARHAASVSAPRTKLSYATVAAEEAAAERPSDDVRWNSSATAPAAEEIPWDIGVPQ